ncbi:hypothetical protein [Halopolyspora algeriensis]|uniref:hypothetical protein n=1 Tax=Halopolyspora algeriensis TaxID=1500506 RepID=UPI000DF26360|nr:hypothetical protein [Halopolyspora algeriensis]
MPAARPGGQPAALSGTYHPTLPRADQPSPAPTRRTGSSTGAGRNLITTSTPLRHPRSSTPATDREPRKHVARRASTADGHTHAAGTVSPVQFIEPEHARDLPEQHHPVADRSDAGMRRLRTPFAA